MRPGEKIPKKAKIAVTQLGVVVDEAVRAPR